MSRLTFTRIEPGDERDVADPNAWWDAWEAATVAANQANFSEAGLDRLAFEPNPFSRRRATISSISRIAVAPIVGFSQFFMGATGFRTSNLGPLSANHALRIRSYVYFSSLVGAGLGLPVNSLFEMKHRILDNGALNDIPASLMRKRFGNAAATWGGNAPAESHYCAAIESWWLTGSVNVDWIELSYQMAGAVDANCDRAILVVEQFDMMRVA